MIFINLMTSLSLPYIIVMTLFFVNAHIILIYHKHSKLFWFLQFRLMCCVSKSNKKMWPVAQVFLYETWDKTDEIFLEKLDFCSVAVETVIPALASSNGANELFHICLWFSWHGQWTDSDWLIPFEITRNHPID